MKTKIHYRAHKSPSVVPVRSLSPLPPSLKLLSSYHLCLCLPSCLYFFSDFRTKCVFPHPKWRCHWNCSCCPEQRNFKFTEPLIAFTTVRCNEVGNVWRIKRSVRCTEADNERPVSPICVTSLTPVNTLRAGSFKLFKRPLPGYLTILTL